MKFIDDVELVLTGRRGYVDVPLTSITQEFNELKIHIDEKVEYTIRLRWGYQSYCQPKDIDRAKETAIKMLKHQLYGELKGDPLELQRDAFGSDWEAVRNKVNSIIDKLDF